MMKADLAGEIWSALAPSPIRIENLLILAISLGFRQGPNCHANASKGIQINESDESNRKPWFNAFPTPFAMPRHKKMKNAMDVSYCATRLAFSLPLELGVPLPPLTCLSFFSFLIFFSA
jgi:hypothetical protein